jgi:hypothetical protein
VILELIGLCRAHGTWVGLTLRTALQGRFWLHGGRSGYRVAGIRLDSTKRYPSLSETERRRERDAASTLSISIDTFGGVADECQAGRGGQRLQPAI